MNMERCLYTGRKMKYQEIYDYFGGVAKIAEALNISRQAVWRWSTFQNVPLRRQYEIERLTGGVLKANEFIL